MIVFLFSLSKFWFGGFQSKLKTFNLPPKPLCFLAIVGLSLFSFLLKGVGKDILIGKFSLVLLVLSDLAMCMA
jgi:hypothetical protein